MRFVSEGQKVRLTPKAAEAYGMSKDRVFTVKGIFPDPKYKKFWVCLNELEPPENVVRPSDLRPALQPVVICEFPKQFNLNLSGKARGR